MSLKITENESASRELTVDIARFECDEDTLLLEFAKIMSPDEDPEFGEIEVRSRLRMPMVSAAPMWVSLAESLIEYEKMHKTGFGISLSEMSEEDLA